MHRQTKTGATNTGFKPKTFINAGGISKGFDAFNCRKNVSFGQCQKCGSDYMKFSVDGFCQYCQQRCEFIMREHPHIANEIKNRGRGVVAL